MTGGQWSTYNKLRLQFSSKREKIIEGIDVRFESGFLSKHLMKALSLSSAEYYFESVMK